MKEINFTFQLEEQLKKNFEKKADLEHRTIAGQLRLLMEAWVEDKIETK